MRLRADERGVTVQIGTVLLFAVLVVLLSTYQAQVVPQENAQVEFNHNQQVHGQLQDLRDELHRTAATDSGGSASIALGTQYPVRALFVNPPPSAGTLQTTDLGTGSNVSIENAIVSGETGDYWDGSGHNFSTRAIRYEPNYNVYQDAPTTMYENGVLYNQFEDGNVTVAGQQLVRGNTVSLVAVNGTVSKSTSRSMSVSPTAVSASTRTVTIRNETPDEKVSIVVPTTRPTDEAVGLWKRLLAEQMASDGPDKHVEAIRPGPRDRTVQIVFEPGTYQLQLAKVGVGNDVSGVEAHYVTDVSGDNASVAENSARTVVVEVRDRFNNPVTGTSVNATLVGGLPNDAIATDDSRGTTLTDLQTDSDGRVEIRYELPSNFNGANRDVTVRVSTTRVPTGTGFSPGNRANLSFNLTAVNTDGSGLVGGGSGGSDGAYQTLWNRTAIDDMAGMDCFANGTCHYDRSEGRRVELTTDTVPTAQDAIVDFEVNDSDVARFQSETETTDDDGDTTVTLRADSLGNVTVYASSGGSGDRLHVDIRESDGAPPGIIYNEDASSTRGNRNNGPQSGLTFSITNGLPEDATLTDVRIEPQDSSIDGLSDPSTDEGPFESELHVDAQRDGTSDIGGGTSLPVTIDISEDGQSPSFGNPTLSLQQEPIVAGDGGTATFSLYEFEDDEVPVDMTDEPVNVTLYFADHSPVEFTLNEDTADDGGDDGGSQPQISFRVDDLSHDNENRVNYVASYDVSDTNGSFQRVSVVYDNVNRGPSATGVNNSTALRGNRRYGLTYGAGEQWRVTLRVIYENDAGEEYVAASRSLTDDADAVNPSGNDDLSTAASPELDGYTVSDRTNPGRGPRYRLDYDVTTNGNFGKAQGAAIAVSGGGADIATSADANGRIDLAPGYGRGSEFRVKFLVYDGDGAVVAVRSETDTAN